VIAWVLALALQGVPAGSPPIAAAEPSGVAAALVLDLNHASAEELTQLPGIGPKRAEAIVARRKQRPFTRVTQLLEVKGIGKRTLERLRPHLRLVPSLPVPPKT
jgi:competence protein ComEA